MMYKLKTIKNISAVLILIAGITVLFGCFFGTPIEKTVTPTIRAIGIPTASAISSITISATDSGGIVLDETTLSGVPSIPAEFTLSMPAGNNITFELTINMGTASAIASYKGTALADISKESATVDITMGIERTRIIVPDAYNYRIVQIDDMFGNGWTPLTGEDLGFTYNSDFVPYDIDMDQYGNIYIANNAGNPSLDGIYVINSINYTFEMPLPTYFADSGEGYESIKSIAIDKNTNRIYGLGWSSVFYWDAPGDSTGEINISTATPKGLAVDEDGNVYVSGYIYTSADYPWIGKYSSTGDKLLTYTGSVANEIINDVTILNGELYATINNGDMAARIEKFNTTDLKHTSEPFSYGEFAGSPSNPEEFMGPYNFLATMNNKLTMIDYYSDLESIFNARIISFNDILGTGWTQYGTFGTGIDQFSFFYETPQ